MSYPNCAFCGKRARMPEDPFCEEHWIEADDWISRGAPRNDWCTPGKGQQALQWMTDKARAHGKELG